MTKLLPSTRKGKRFMVEQNGVYIHFGDKNMENYTMHKDKDRRRSFYARHWHVKNITDVDI